jgi:hypothetical protein
MTGQNDSGSEDRYGELPPAKLARLRALVEKGLTTGLTAEELRELEGLYLQAGGEPVQAPKEAPKDYVFEMAIAEQDLAAGKRPPLCDGCNEPFQTDEKGVVNVTALVLDGYIYGLECESDIRSYFAKMPRLAEKDAPDEAKRALHDVLGRDMSVGTW